MENQDRHSKIRNAARGECADAILFSIFTAIFASPIGGVIWFIVLINFAMGYGAVSDATPLEDHFMFLMLTLPFSLIYYNDDYVAVIAIINGFVWGAIFGAAIGLLLWAMINFKGLQDRQHSSSPPRILATEEGGGGGNAPEKGSEKRATLVPEEKTRHRNDS